MRSDFAAEYSNRAERCRSQCASGGDAYRGARGAVAVLCAPVGPRLAGPEAQRGAPPDRGHARLRGRLGFHCPHRAPGGSGRAGTEEINEIVSSTFGELAGIAGRYGADLLKWGGDAAVLLFQGPGSAQRGARCGWLMARAMRRLGRLSTSVGRIELKVSVGAHTGAFELFLTGESHRELIVAGPGATLTTELEQAAGAGEVLVSEATAAFLDGSVLGEVRGGGVLLRGEPGADEQPVPPERAGRPEDAASLVPVRARAVPALRRGAGRAPAGGDRVCPPVRP